MEFGSPESRAIFAASQNKKALAEKALKEKNTKIKEAVKNLQGTQADHHVTEGKNVTKTIGKGLSSGGVAGLALSAVAAYKEENKRIANMKKQVN